MVNRDLKYIECTRLHDGGNANNVDSETLTPESTVNVRLNWVLNFLFDKRL